MRYKVRVFLTLLGLALLAGCIEFKSQTLTYTHDTTTDTLRIFQDYHGIFGGDNPKELTSAEAEQLDSVLNSQRTFFFGNWISEISHNQLRDRLDKLASPEMQKENENELDPPAREHLEQLITLLLENSHMQNGTFFMDKEGKLAAVQHVTISNVSKLISVGNMVIRDAYKTEARNSKTQAEERKLYEKSSESQQDYIKLEGNRLTVRLPLTRTHYEEHMSHAADELDEFKKNGGSTVFTNDEVVITIGRPTDKLTRLTMSVSDKPFTTNLLNVVKGRSLLKPKFEPEGEAQRFLSSRQ